MSYDLVMILRARPAAYVLWFRCLSVDLRAPVCQLVWLLRCGYLASLVPLGIWLYRWWISAFSSSCRVLVVVYVDIRIFLFLPFLSLSSSPVSS